MRTVRIGVIGPCDAGAGGAGRRRSWRRFGPGLADLPTFLEMGSDVTVHWRQIEDRGSPGLDAPSGPERQSGSDAPSGSGAPSAARAYIVVADPGDEAAGMLGEFARDQGLTAAQLTAVGAFARATVGWFDRDAKDYRAIEVDEQCEVLSLLGDVAMGEDGPAVHAHMVLGLANGTVRGGHLLRGEVWPTLEVIVREAPAELRKTFRPDIGLALIDLER